MLIDGLQLTSSSVGVANSVATLDSNSKVASAQLPSLSITDTFVVASQAAMLALSTAEQGDVAVRMDVSKSFILKGTSPSTLADWQELLTPADTVSSVAGRQGNVTLVKADVGLSNVDNTSDASKPVSTAQATAIALKLDASQKNAANGVAGLDGNSKVTINQIPSDSVLALLSSTNVTTALGFTPYNATNPSGYQTAAQVSAAVAGASVTSTAGITTWTGTPYDISGSCFGVPAASQVDIRFVVGRAFTIPTNLAGAIAKAGVAATASTAFVLQKNGSTVATFTFAAAGTTASLSSQAAISFAIGDVFKIVAPATADATCADIDFFIPAIMD